MDKVTIEGKSLAMKGYVYLPCSQLHVLECMTFPLELGHIHVYFTYFCLVYIKKFH
jgi:hypothetical protein